MTKAKTFYIENLGCFKNQVDAEYIISSLENAGYTSLPEPEGAGVIFVNTCSFIESAKTESINTFFDFKQAYPEAKIVVAGCLSQRYGDQLRDLLPEADGIFGNRAPGDVTKIMADVEAGKKPSYFPVHMKEPPRRKKFLGLKKSVYVKISEGCANHCTFCAIPKFRGSLASRTSEDVLEEVRQLVAQDSHELNLIAQDLASFGLDRGQDEFQALMENILKIPGDFWVRMLYLYPDRFPEGVLELCQKDRRLLPYFDLPFQHASGRILKLMGRRGTKDEYLALIQRIREALPDAVIRSTFIVGFPGETDKDFEELLDFQAKAQLDWMGVFSYSREEDTPAFRMQTESAWELAQPQVLKRKEILEDRQAEITAQRLDRWIGREMEILIEEPVVGSDLALGRGFPQAYEVDGLVVVHGEGLQGGQRVKAKILRRNGVDLEAKVLQ